MIWTPTVGVNLKRLLENLPSLRKFGMQFLAGLSLAQKFILSGVVGIQLDADQYLGKSAQERITGDMTVNVTENLHAVNVGDGYERTGFPFGEGLTVRQSGQRGD